MEIYIMSSFNRAIHKNSIWFTIASNDINHFIVI